MQIVCPQCATSYMVADAAISDGRVVRCTGCGHVWLAPAADAVAAAGAMTRSSTPAEAGIMSAGGTSGANVPAGGEPMPSAASDTAASESTDIFPDPAENPPVNDAAVTDAPSLVPDHDPLAGTGPAGRGETIDADRGDDEFARQRAARRRRAAQRRGISRPSWTTIVLALMAIIAAILAFRTQVVRAMPQTASLFATMGLPVNLRGLAFHQVAAEKEMTDGIPVLIVEGTVVNVTRRLIEVPRLRFALRDPAGTEVYHWTALPQTPVLGPGDVMPFRTRLASPPANGENLVIRFFRRSDH